MHLLKVNTLETQKILIRIGLTQIESDHVFLHSLVI